MIIFCFGQWEIYIYLEYVIVSWDNNLITDYKANLSATNIFIFTYYVSKMFTSMWVNFSSYIMYNMLVDDMFVLWCVSSLMSLEEDCLCFNNQTSNWNICTTESNIIIVNIYKYYDHIYFLTNYCTFVHKIITEL